jgi:hypothetical protein
MKSSGRSNQVADHCLSLDFEVGFLSPDSSVKALFRPRGKKGAAVTRRYPTLPGFS